VIKKNIDEHINICQKIKQQKKIILEIVDIIIKTFKNGNKLLICGNGGSAADAQHIAAEFVGKFSKWRKALPVMALSVNSSIVTALGNDCGYENIFSRQIDAFACFGDVVVVISTSGNSENILQAIKAGKRGGCVVIGFTGYGTEIFRNYVDYCLCVDSLKTPRIQEIHIMIWHIICELVENKMGDLGEK
jgi:D-sedoheptulose 7-phosphate isomerase